MLAVRILWVGMLAAVQARTPPSTSPNILFVLADDTGWGEETMSKACAP